MNENFSQHIFSGHCAYSEISSDWAFMGEVLVIDQDAKKLPGLTTFEGGYVQVSKQFYWPFLNESQSLYFRFEKVDGYLGILGIKDKYVAGINVEINDVTLMKFEVQQIQPKNGKSETLFLFQNAIYY